MYLCCVCVCMCVCVCVYCACVVRVCVWGVGVCVYIYESSKFCLHHEHFLYFYGKQSKTESIIFCLKHTIYYLKNLHKFNHYSI